MSRTSLPGGFLDPDGWIEFWQRLHGSPLIVGEVARLALVRLEAGEKGLGRHELHFQDPMIDEWYDVDVEYAIEDVAGRGRIFFLLKLHSDGDPLSPITDEA